MRTGAEREELKKRLIELTESDLEFVISLLNDVWNEIKQKK